MRRTLALLLFLVAALTGVAAAVTEAGTAEEGAAVAGATVAGATVAGDWAPATADREALAAVVAENRVTTTPEQPGFGAYLRDLSLAFFAWLATFLGLSAKGLQAVTRTFGWLGAPLVYGALLALLVLLVVRLVRSRRSTSGRTAPAAAAALAPAVGRRDRGEWEAELRRRLEVGAATAACEALWWWLALCLAGEEAEPSWTSRELLRATGRPDLGAPMRRLDRFLYGLRPPSIGEVRGLWEELRGSVVAPGAAAEAAG